MRRDVFQAIADPTRRAILGMIVARPLTPNQLAAEFRSSRQAVSKHIRILLECRLVQQEQSGREIYYLLNPEKLKEVDQWLDGFRDLWDIRFGQLDAVLKNMKNKTP